MPLTGLWQPAGAAGGGTAPMPRTGRWSAARGLSPERSQVGGTAPAGRRKRAASKSSDRVFCERATLSFEERLSKHKHEDFHDLSV